MEEGMPPEKKGMLSKSIPFGNDSVACITFSGSQGRISGLRCLASLLLGLLRHIFHRLVLQLQPIWHPLLLKEL